jgi:hypothetical protein
MFLWQKQAGKARIDNFFGNGHQELSELLVGRAEPGTRPFAT